MHDLSTVFITFCQADGVFAWTRARRRRIRLGTALGAALLLAASLAYTSFSAASDARTPSQLLASRRAGPRLPAHRPRGARLPPSQGDGSTSASATATAPASVPVRYAGAVPDPFRAGPRGDRHRAACGAAPSSASATRWSRSARRSSAPPGPDRERLTLGRACLVLALRSRLRHRAPRSYGARARPPRLGRVGPPRGLRAGRRAHAGLRDPRGGVPALGLHASRSWPRTRARRRRRSTGGRRCGRRRRGRCCCGSGCCRCGRAWCCS